MRTRVNTLDAGTNQSASCRCTQGFQESWNQLEANPASEWTPTPPAFLADSEDWAHLYRAGVNYQDGVRVLLGPEGESLTDSEVDLLLERITDSMDSTQAAEFLGGIGRALQGALPVLGQVAQTALPIVGGAVGSVIAPGVGTALGGALGGVAGNLVGQAVNRAAAQPARPGHAPVRPTVPLHAPSNSTVPSSIRTGPFVSIPGNPAVRYPSQPSPITGSAAQQLLSLLNNPQLLGGLANAALGGAGAMPGGGAPLGPLLGSLARLAEGVAAEVADDRMAGYALESESDTTEALAHRLVNAIQGVHR